MPNWGTIVVCERCPRVGEPARPGDLPRLLDGLDPRGDDPVGATVEQPANHAVLPLRDPHHGRHTKAAGGGAQCGGDVGRYRGVFEVDHDAVVARRVRNVHDIRGAAAANAQHQRQFARMQAVQELISGSTRARLHRITHQVSVG
jgi:hypothetical protein